MVPTDKLWDNGLKHWNMDIWNHDSLFMQVILIINVKYEGPAVSVLIGD